MIDNADLVVAYVEANRKGGALETIKYAKRKSVEIISLAERERGRACDREGIPCSRKKAPPML